MRVRVVNFVVVIVSVALGACASPDFVDPRGLARTGHLPGEEVDPFNVEYSFEITGQGAFVGLGSTEIPASDYSYDPAFLDDPGATTDLPAEPVEKLSPVLKDRLGKLPAGALEAQRVTISFANDVEIPHFAQTVGNEPADSPANLAVIARNDELIRQIEVARQPDYDRLTPQLERAGAKVVETDWLTGGITVELPLQAVPNLLTLKDLLYVTSSDETSPPPLTVAQNRATINSDSFYNLGSPTQDGGMIALLDTGVQESHVFISQGSYSRVRDQFICYGTNPCAAQQSSAFRDPCNHGTASAAILSGNTTDNAYRGVTGIGIDSYIIYPTSGCGGDINGALEAFRQAVNRGHKLIVAEMQFQTAPNSALTLAAANAFNSGAVVIAANGNVQSGITAVGAPANGNRVIGVGLSNYSGQHQVGPVQGRNKPDILAPSFADTAASSQTSNSATRAYTGTSGATPFAAGAAALLRNYFEHELGIREPGHVYAYLINSGNDPYPFSDASGAGLIRLGNSRSTIGKVSLSDGQTLNRTFTLTAPSDYDYMKAAIWWPDNATHSNVNLALVDPGGTVRATSNGANGGVFEMVRVNNPVAGNWTVRITGQDVSGSQTVYYVSGAQR